MSLVKAKDMPYETACLEKRIQFVSDLKTVLGKNSLVSQTVDLYTDLIEDILYDVCLDVHRDIVMGIERDAVGSHPGEDQGEERVARRTSGTRHSDPSGSHADALEPLDETKETVEVAHASGSRKRQARARSPPGSGRQTSKRRSEGTEPNKGSKEADADRGKGGHVEETTAEPLTMEEMLKQAAIHYGSATMLGVQMSGSKGAVDMFGNMIQPVSLDLVACPNCGRNVSSGRFAPHLEKCMGGGRQASRGRDP